jgi:hypothetical protein
MGILDILFSEMVCLQMTDITAGSSDPSFTKPSFKWIVITVIIVADKPLSATMTMIPECIHVTNLGIESWTWNNSHRRLHGRHLTRPHPSGNHSDNVAHFQYPRKQREAHFQNSWDPLIIRFAFRQPKCTPFYSLGRKLSSTFGRTATIAFLISIVVIDVDLGYERTARTSFCSHRSKISNREICSCTVAAHCSCHVNQNLKPYTLSNSFVGWCGIPKP